MYYHNHCLALPYSPQNVSFTVDLSHIRLYILHGLLWICLSVQNLQHHTPLDFFDNVVFMHIFPGCQSFQCRMFQWENITQTFCLCLPLCASISELVCLFKTACQEGRSHFRGIPWLKPATSAKIILLSSQAVMKHHKLLLGNHTYFFLYWFILRSWFVFFSSLNRI